MSADAGIAAGLRVIEIGSSTAVAVAGVALADAGADVAMIEPPGGSPLRNAPAFAMWGRGKRSIVADLATDEGRDRLFGILTTADVCMIGLKPISVERFGLTYDALSTAAPQLVVALLTGFGMRGPYPNVPVYDGVMQARGGRMVEFETLSGFTRPSFAASPVTAHSAAAALITGVYGALAERERNGGQGQLIETSLAHAMTVYDLRWWAPGATYEPKRDDVPFLPYATARTADNVWIQFAQNGPDLFADYLRVLGLDGEFNARQLFVATDPELKRTARARIHESVASRTWAEWQECFATERNLSVEKFWAPGEALDHPQFVAIGDTITVDDPEHGRTRQLGPLFDVPARPLAPQRGPSAIGGGEVSWPARPAPPAGTPGPQGKGLLSGVTILEFGMWIALPFAATILAELGARVIKLEPIGGDPMRGSGMSGYKIVQGKESVMIDLKAPGAREIVDRLVAQADVLMHSYRPGVPERLGIDFESARRINPRIVYVYNGSYGSRGPKAYAPAFHVTGGAVAGGCFAQAGAACPPPPDITPSADEQLAITRRLELANEANPDFNSAVMAAAAASMGLYSVARTGKAIAIETRMMLSCAWMMGEHFVDFDGRTPPRLPDAELLGTSARYRLYQAADGWVFVAVPNERDIDRLEATLGLAGLVAASRAADEGVLADALGRALAKHNADELEATLTAAGVACVRADQGPYWSYLSDKSWAREQGVVVTAADSMVGPYLRYGPVLTTANPHVPGGAFPAGTNTRAVLGQIGYSPTDIDSLIKAGVIAEP